MPTKPMLIGIAGGSGSGKSWLARLILGYFGEKQCTVIEQDWYYNDLSHVPPSIAEKTNFDHPDALELEMLGEHLSCLRRNQEIEAPQYEFSAFSRKSETLCVPPRPIVLVEGLFVLVPPAIRDQLETSIYVDTPADIRLARRLKRDLEERGYTLDQVLDFWISRAHPMHKEHVAPQKNTADHVWKSLEDNAFVPSFLADLEDRLASNALRSKIT